MTVRFEGRADAESYYAYCKSHPGEGLAGGNDKNLVPVSALASREVATTIANQHDIETGGSHDVIVAVGYNPYKQQGEWIRTGLPREKVFIPTEIPKPKITEEQSTFTLEKKLVDLRLNK